MDTPLFIIWIFGYYMRIYVCGFILFGYVCKACSANFLYTWSHLEGYEVKPDPEPTPSHTYIRRRHYTFVYFYYEKDVHDKP